MRSISSCPRGMPALLAIAAALSGCSSLSTQKLDANARDGLIYYMPKRNFVVTVTRDATRTTDIALGTTAAYADLAKPYVLNFQQSLLAKNKLEIEVNPAGLLTTTKSDTTSDISEAFKALGSSAGSLRALGAGPKLQARIAALGDACEGAGSHVFIIESPEETDSVCGGSIQVRIERLWDKSGKFPDDTPRTEVAGNSGLFYRMNLPYRMTASGDGHNKAAIVLSPTESPTHFLPVARTLFARNDAQITLVEGGIPSKVLQDSAGELSALLKLPADILAAYFEAIGAMFGKRSAVDKAEAAALGDALKLDLARQKYAVCLAAIRAKDEKLISELQCGS